MSDKPVAETIYLLGAGASLPASLPSIGKMTEMFFKDVDTERLGNNFEKKFGSKIRLLQKVVQDQFENPDLESLMTLLIDLKDERYRGLIQAKYKKIKTITTKEVDYIKLNVEGYIRYKLEKLNPELVEYLYPLIGLRAIDYGMHIFTLNYDASLEILCEEHGVKYSDGFEPFWDPKIFDQSYIIFKIFKLHGSLYWLKSKSRKILRVPLKGLDINKVKYLSDDIVSDMMIYPALQKQKYSEVYAWLSERFISSLKRAKTCVILGYSFRDKDIRENITDALYSNQNLSSG